MTVTLDEELIEAAKEAMGVATKSEAIRLALEESLRRRRLERVLDHAGKIEIDLDQERLRRLRELG